ncbi:MAG: hypothetical protein KatS3mg102_0749 [Planctomycetota bacterium]|nr:MAG: hypothetical protein KatS3mg102_0749 [Planctomycetota bacterium]
MRALAAIALLAGLVLGVHGALWLQRAGWLASPPPARVLTGLLPQTEQARGRAVARSRAELEALAERLRLALAEAGERGLEPLAVALEEAAYERDWDRVELLAHLVRELGPDWVGAGGAAGAEATAEPPEAGPASAPPPLVVAARELERRQELRALANRRNAATALLGRTDPEATARLSELFRRAADPQVRRDAARLLARAGETRGLQVLEEALHAPDEELRRAAAAAFAAEGYLSGAAAMAELLAHAGQEELRLSAVEGLAAYDAVLLGSPHPATEALLRALAADPSERVRAAVAAALGICDLERAARVREGLLERLRLDASAAVRRAAAQSCARAAERLGAGPALLRPLEQLLATEADPEVATALLRVLRHGDAETLAVLDALVASPVAGLAPEAFAEARRALRERVEAQRP